MELINNRIVDTVIEYASVKFGVDMEGKAVSELLRELSFGQTMDLIDAIKKEEDSKFAELIDMSSVNESGTISPTQSAVSAQGTMNTAAKQQARDYRTGRGMPKQPVSGSSGAVAGGQKQATGGPQGHGPAMTDPDDVQRQQNAQTAGQAANQAAVNAQEIERLKQLAYGQR